MKKTLSCFLAIFVVVPMMFAGACTSSNASKSVGVASTFVFEVQPSGAVPGAEFSTQPVVFACDIYGDADASFNGAVTLSITPGTGVSGAKLLGTTTVNAVNGVATFTDLSIDDLGNGYTLTASGGNLTPSTSAIFDVASLLPDATAFIFSTQPGAATSGEAFNSQPVVYAVDAAGKVDTNFNLAVTLAITSGTGAKGAVLSGVLTANAVKGVATFSGLSIDLTGTGYSLTASGDSLNPATSNQFEVKVPTAFTFIFSTQPGSATAGSALTIQPVVSVVDANGFVVTGFTGTVTLAITSGTGASGATLSGTVTVTAVNGVATFTDLSIDTAGSAYSLTATSGSLTSATSNTFNVSAAATIS
jgi:hypothetical protein